jgi:carboxyl-terminal processing protease
VLLSTIREEGNLQPAFQIFTVYRDRASSRIGWVLDELDGDFDFSAEDSYVIDRAEANWPGSIEEADELWRRRLKFELIPDLLNEKTIEEARETVAKRYERMLKGLSEITPGEIQETFLTTLTHMYDPHSTYLSAETLEDFSIQMRLSLVGIGALLSSEDGYCVIKELIPGGPAILSNDLHTNDKIVAVAQGNDEPVDIVGMKLRKVVNMIRGEKGTTIVLTINPGDAGDDSVRRQVTLGRGCKPGERPASPGRASCPTAGEWHRSGPRHKLPQKPQPTEQLRLVAFIRRRYKPARSAGKFPTG